MPDADGPNNSHSGLTVLTPLPSLCNAAQNTAAGATNAGDAFSIQLLGFDHPLGGANGQADITISAPANPLPFGYN
ncbi:MAG: hypothetical protein ACXWNZ_14430 [Vulcanimicrobiaceae bacterium]